MGNQCINCNSKSMEECLLIRHCKYWVLNTERGHSKDADNTDNESTKHREKKEFNGEEKC